MADKANVSAGTVTVADTKIKMRMNPAGFQEPDVEAAQAASDENRFSGPNPFPAGTARAAGWDYLKKMSK